MLLNSKINSLKRFNIVFSSQATQLLSLDLKNKTGIIINFPNDLYISNTIHGYGQYPIDSILKVGKLDNRGGETLSGTIRELLGVPVDAYWILPGRVSDLKRYFLNPTHLFNGQSNLNFVDRLNLVLTLMQIRSDKLKNINIDTENILLADGSSAKNLDKDNADNIYSGVFSDDYIQTENARTEIVNTTKFTGLGNRAARIITNIGGSVVNVTTTDYDNQSCSMEVNPKVINSYTVKRLAQIFLCKIISKPLDDRAEIRLILGQDYVNWLTK